MTYTAKTAKQIRQEAGSPAEKLAAEFKAIQDSCNHQRNSRFTQTLHPVQTRILHGGR